MTEQQTKQFWARCMQCTYQWPFAPAPLSVTRLCNAVKGMMCPGCGVGSKDIALLATEDKDGNPIHYTMGRTAADKDGDSCRHA
jgi:hypothetical protein